MLRLCASVLFASNEGNDELGNVTPNLSVVFFVQWIIKDELEFERGIFKFDRGYFEVMRIGLNQLIQLS